MQQNDIIITLQTLLLLFSFYRHRKYRDLGFGDMMDDTRNEKKCNLNQSSIEMTFFKNEVLARLFLKAIAQSIIDVF